MGDFCVKLRFYELIRLYSSDKEKHKQEYLFTMRLRRTVRKAENYARYSICRPNCLILILLFATPILVLYHMGLLHRNTVHNSDALKSEGHGGGGARPAI